MEEEQNQPEVMQELLLKLMKDLQIFKGIQLKQAEQEEQAAKCIPFGGNTKGYIDSFGEIFKLKHAFKTSNINKKKFKELMSKLLEDVRNINEELSEFINSLSWNRPTFYNDDDEYTIIYRKHKEITPGSSTVEPDNSLSMGDEHLNTTPEMEKSSVESPCPNPKDDLVDLYKIMLQKTTAYGPEEDLERAFAKNLRIMFDPPQSEDTV
ncbi:hypothetical protein Tco_1183835 [Tanacetum coccineum]